MDRINVLLLTRYERLGASSRVRFLQFLPELERQGFDFDVQPLLDNDYVRSLYGGPPVGAGGCSWPICGAFARSRAACATTWSGSRRKRCPGCRRGSRSRVCRDCLTSSTTMMPGFTAIESHWLSPLLGHKIDAVMRVAWTVVAGNDFLARHARQAGARHVEIVPSAIDTARYRDLPPRRRRCRGDPWWSAGSAFRSTRIT